MCLRGATIQGKGDAARQEASCDRRCRTRASASGRARALTTGARHACREKNGHTDRPGFSHGVHLPPRGIQQAVCHRRGGLWCGVRASCGRRRSRWPKDRAAAPGLRVDPPARSGRARAGQPSRSSPWRCRAAGVRSWRPCRRRGFRRGRVACAPEARRRRSSRLKTIELGVANIRISPTLIFGTGAVPGR